MFKRKKIKENTNVVNTGRKKSKGNFFFKLLGVNMSEEENGTTIMNFDKLNEFNPMLGEMLMSKLKAQGAYINDKNEVVITSKKNNAAKANMEIIDTTAKIINEDANVKGV